MHEIPLGKFRSACGGIVEVSERSKRHLEAHPEVAAILVEAIGKAEIGDGAFGELEVDMGRVIGRKSLLTTDCRAADSVMTFALRNGRDFPSRVVAGGAEGANCNTVVIVVKRTRPGNYVLVTSWVGSLARKEPWDKTIRDQEQLNQSLDFWCRNALIHDPATMGPVFESSWSEILAENLALVE